MLLIINISIMFWCQRLTCFRVSRFSCLVFIAYIANMVWQTLNNLYSNWVSVHVFLYSCWDSHLGFILNSTHGVSLSVDRCFKVCTKQLLKYLQQLWVSELFTPLCYQLYFTLHQLSLQLVAVDSYLNSNHSIDIEFVSTCDHIAICRHAY